MRREGYLALAPSGAQPGAICSGCRGRGCRRQRVVLAGRPYQLAQPVPVRRRPNRHPVGPHRRPLRHQVSSQPYLYIINFLLFLSRDRQVSDTFADVKIVRKSIRLYFIGY